MKPDTIKIGAKLGGAIDTAIFDENDTATLPNDLGKIGA